MRWTVSAVIIAALTLACPSSAEEPAAGARIARLNEAFLQHVNSLGPEHAIAAATVNEAWKTVYRDALAESFVPDALAVVHGEYREALNAFDDGRFEDAARLFGELREHADHYVAANSEYFHARALAALGRYEEVGTTLATIDQRADELAQHTSYAPHLWLMKAVCEARNLDFERATQTLASLAERFADAPEAVRIGAAQLLLEVERRERGTLGEIATVMDYVADRLHVRDGDQRVRERQDDVIAMLDKLIEEHEQKEQQCGGGGKGGGGGKSQPRAQGQGRERSEAPGGEGRIGDLHRAPEAAPGQAWGKLPPAERERILQSIRERFPSRYRRLVEQYYRNLAEEK